MSMYTEYIVRYGHVSGFSIQSIAPNELIQLFQITQLIP